MRRVALLPLLLLAAPLLAQDETLWPNAENDPSTVLNDSCTTACNATDCSTDVSGSDGGGTGEPDGNEVSTLTTDATIRFEFGTPASNPGGTQTMNLVMSRCDDDASCTERTGGSGDPIFDAIITCNGTDDTTIYTDEIITTTDQLKSNTFSFPAACAADGSDLGVRLVLTDQGGGPNKNFPCIEEIYWEVTYAGAGPGPGLMMIE